MVLQSLVAFEIKETPGVVMKSHRYLGEAWNPFYEQGYISPLGNKKNFITTLSLDLLSLVSFKLQIWKNKLKILRKKKKGYQCMERVIQFSDGSNPH